MHIHRYIYIYIHLYRCIFPISIPKGDTQPWLATISFMKDRHCSHIQSSFGNWRNGISWESKGPPPNATAPQRYSGLIQGVFFSYVIVVNHHCPLIRGLRLYFRGGDGIERLAPLDFHEKMPGTWTIHQMSTNLPTPHL